MVFGLALVMALVVGAASTAWSATGGNFILGKGNSAGAASKLTANVAAPALALVNKSTAAAATALNLTVPAGKAPLTVNATAGTATNLSADKLDGLSSEELVRSGLGVTQNAFPFATYTDSTTVTVNAPAKGFVLVNGTVSAHTNSPSCDPCYTFARPRHDNSGQEPQGQLSSLGNGTSSIQRDTLPVSWVFPVEAGTNTFTLRTAAFPDSAPVDFYNPTLTALYVPFGASGTSAPMADSEAVSSTQEERGQRSDGVVVE
jgi:hypothetical protein